MCKRLFYVLHRFYLKKKLNKKWKKDTKKTKWFQVIILNGSLIEKYRTKKKRSNCKHSIKSWNFFFVANNQ